MIDNLGKGAAGQAVQLDQEDAADFLGADILAADGHDMIATRTGTENVADTPNGEARNQQQQQRFEVPGLYALSQGFEHTRFLETIENPALRRGAAY